MSLDLFYVDEVGSLKIISNANLIVGLAEQLRIGMATGRGGDGERDSPSPPWLGNRGWGRPHSLSRGDPTPTCTIFFLKKFNN